MAAERRQNAETELTPGAAVLAWLWPGAGHMALGERKRGLYIMAGVLLLFVSGLLIGGVNVVDRRDDRLWFIAQVFCGPVTLAADFTNQRFVKAPLQREIARQTPQLPDPEHWRSVGLAHVNEIGKLYCALAGLMNLVAILDALHFTPRRPIPDKQRQRRATDRADDATQMQRGAPDRGNATA